MQDPNADPLRLSLPKLPLNDRLADARHLSFEGRDDELLALLDDPLDALAAPEDAAARIQALVLRARSLVRLGRFEEATVVYARAPVGAQGAQMAEGRAHLLVGMAFACIHLGLPARALTLANAAFKLALTGGFTPLASHALDCVGICRALMGEPLMAEHFFLQALGMALQHGDDSIVQMRLSNLLYCSISQFDAAQAAGDVPAATQALRQCARFAAQGDRLVRRTGVYERTLWRSNRAAWLRRRGRVDEAIADYEAVMADSVRHGWAVMQRSAGLDLALALVEVDRTDDAVAALRALLASVPEKDSYHIALAAHGRLESLLGPDTPQGRLHGAAHRELAAARDAARARAAEALAQSEKQMALALAAADQVRLDAEVEHLRERENAARNEAFLTAEILSMY